jgi:hypothetical protein
MLTGFTFGEYSNEELGVIAVHFGTVNGGTLYDGEVTDLVTDKSSKSNEYEVISHRDKQPQGFPFQIINQDGLDIGQEQERFLNKVMCKKYTYQWLFFHEERYSDIWIKCIMHNPKIWDVAGAKGMQFDVVSSSPYAFTDERECNYTFTDTDKVINDLYINSDIDDPIFPDLEITVLQAGNLTITNENESDSNWITTINNLAVGEVINIKDKKITSSILTHDVFNDTNKKWLRLYNDYNQITFSLKCQVTLKYREYRRMVIY